MNTPVLQLQSEAPPSPKLKRYASTQGHGLSLIEEHYEEAATLWAQRQLLASQEDIPWTRVGAFENRFEAHLDALVLSGEKAERMGLERFAENPEYLPVLISLVCRNGNHKAFHQILSEMDTEDAHIEALEKAMDAEIPSAWVLKTWDWTLETKPELAKTILKVGATRPLEFDIRSVLNAHDKGQIPSSTIYEFIHLGKRLAYLPWLKTQPIWTEEAASRHEGIHAYLACGEIACLSPLMEKARNGDHHALKLGSLLDSLALRDALIKQAKPDEIDWDLAMSLVHSGNIQSIPILIEKLSSPGSVEAAAWALQCITGADLLETHLELDPDDNPSPALVELRIQKGFSPQQGEVLERPARDPQIWKSWWEKNQARFPASIALRLGRPWNATTLLGSLQDPQTNYRLHRMTFQEWRFRLGRFNLGFRYPSVNQWKKYFAGFTHSL